MDTKNTLHVNGSFLPLLQSLAATKTKVAILLDCKGMVRAEGIIESVVIEDMYPHLLMIDGNKVVIKNIVAVNGVFSPEYSEC